ncbi:protein monoglycylase TTLL8-like isoform X1 [Scyliorhinus canicula]|uniref:protein monoglycylase TTLL8-like isoform X1 n=1 Tax=Scyliorhinus canicula TaxID=7830 RepID=UPI0018F4C3AA|nr:protein monoglycylase TTLL8-like isoform X1 [Scyliorhinus canicula]
MCAGIQRWSYQEWTASRASQIPDVLRRPDFQRALKGLAKQGENGGFPLGSEQPFAGGGSTKRKKENLLKNRQEFSKKDSMIPECQRREKIFDEDSEVTNPLRYNSTKKYQVLTRQVKCSAKQRLELVTFLAETAVKEKKIFTIIGYYPVIRASLRKRGWAERTFPTFKQVARKNGDKDVNPDINRLSIRMWATKQLTRSDDKLDNQAGDEPLELQEEEESHFNFNSANSIHYLVSNMISKEIPYFIWTIRRNAIDCHYLHSDQMINHYAKNASFTTKARLCMNLRKLPSYLDENADIFFPRCYLVSDETDECRLRNDFRLTSAICILKWVIYNSSSDLSSPSTGEGQMEKDHTEGNKEALVTGSGDPGKTDGQLSTTLIRTAIRVCKDFLQSLKQAENYLEVYTPPTLSEMEWAGLIEQHYYLIHNQVTIPGSRNYLIDCQNILNRLKSVHPQLEIDGIRNIWIVKPAAMSRGRGIKCVERLDEFLKLKDLDPSFENPKWVVQKYIEKPLLIYDTKFDIRMWFLVTDWKPLNVWFYKDCYLRFSTQPFTLENLDSSVHLCNNAIQKRLKPSIERNPLVPKESMWSSDQFQEYLKIKGRRNIWQGIVYPSMKKAIICSLMTVQATIPARKNNFGLYGADFLLGEDFKSWLIEINLSPSMSRSTSVTALLCANVQEDTIKVIIDRKYNSKCNIGQFECMSTQERKYLSRSVDSLRAKSMYKDK